ncbi:protein-disulfide reductase DsbD family protein [Salinibacter ruber]|uniref:Thiol:disulfide interchange protein DsbD n=1 Tax=Salinibacter ruber TaxID=146919 RepID=A0A9X2U5U7_9BACT|nr:thioredoxin family protein [Salinibacter ruber]MCS3656152.1 thiol:disulfide interchange protein DsbD [Salinibacter ruber]MCS3685829.1 thiol:disulfide interchange protein DsbD [Salinibacter ruber]MCS3950335.1 thiol:disulfide interchange protein DsbD [Salinibacter ruber]MCS4117098.1 thiol:disulfide interchange protein DsbD [Salinibacter ruber]MCS4153938.1 thiol:disulfide interchange protein DsbD [Salinibacter ruber]
MTSFQRSSGRRCLVLGVWLLVVLWGSGAATPLQAQSQASDDPSPHSEATLVSEQDAIVPGEPLTVGLRLNMEEGWHSYWKNPGASGEPTSIDWALPEGYETSGFQWPYPHQIEFGSLISYGYSDEVLLIATVTPPDTLTPGTTATLGGRAKWLICEEICLPAHSDVEVTLPVAEEASPKPGRASAFEAARAKHPKRVSDWSVGAGRSEGRYTLILGAPDGARPDLEGAYFFPAEKSVVDPGAPQPVTRNGDTYTIALRQSAYAQAPADRLRGVLVAPEGTGWDPDGRVRAMQVDVPVDSTLSAADAMGAGASSAGGGLSLPWALAFALVGGVLLNLMPCVFPVLSVKILGFAEEAGGEAGAMRRHGLLFGAGVLGSMWILAGGLLALRAAGSQIGWGFQLQSPIFIALMTMLFFGIGLNLLGAFEVGTTLMGWGGRMEAAASGGGNLSAFLTGVLATVVATPCTAPFMGAALGVALTLSTVGALLIFTALGVGMAAPYVVLSTTPALLDRLPDPGAWMETLKQAFAFPMFATAIWLVWVFGQQTSTGGVAFLLAGLLLLGVAAWIVNRWSAPQLSQTATLVTRGLAGAALVGGIAVAVIGAGSAPAEQQATATATDASGTDTTWRSYAPETIESLRAEGRPVFVDFTAAWCLTCQVNKRRVLTAESVQNAFDEKDVALVRADWTSRDPEITRALESHGRSGVPVYVLYAGDGSEPELLPEVLTEDAVLNALDDLSSTVAATHEPH